VAVPVRKVTCCCFGGERRSTLFSTARVGLSPEEQPDAGRVFAVETAVTGPAAFPARWTT
jgi:sugar lactone lactonase YvrE